MFILQLWRFGSFLFAVEGAQTPKRRGSERDDGRGGLRAGVRLRGRANRVVLVSSSGIGSQTKVEQHYFMRSENLWQLVKNNMDCDPEGRGYEAEDGRAARLS